MSRFSPYWLWLLLSLPAIGFISSILNSNDPQVFNNLLHSTGEFSARFMIIAMLVTPLALLFKGRQWPKWLRKNRRYFGVAAFCYALMHTVFYIIDAASMAQMLAELPRLSIWTGWVAFVIFIPLACTSFDYFVARMGARWKQLQRWIYVAAVLTLVHWAALHEWTGLGPALVHFVPLGLLEAYRVWYWNFRPK